MVALNWLPDGAEASAPSGAYIYTFILKIASRCNLACDYCYVYEGPDQSWRARPKFMSEGIAHRTFQRIQEHVKDHNLDEVLVTFHGGEPMLAGVDRMRMYLEKAKETIECRVMFATQTNGTLLTPQFLSLFDEFDVEIGLSIDGGREENDRFRRFRNGRSSHDRVMQAIELVDSRPEWSRLLTGVLAVIELENNPSKVFSFLNSLGRRGIDLLLPNCNYTVEPSRLKTDYEKNGYGVWMADFFDAWASSGSDVQIRYFEEIMAMILGQNSIMENIGAKYVDLIIVESDGAIEPVDTLKMVNRSATDISLNVETNTFTDALKEEAVYSRMLGFESLCTTCRNCTYLERCAGGYLPHRYSNENGFQNPSVYCHDIKYIIDHIEAKLSEHGIIC